MCGRDDNNEKVHKEYIPLYMGFDIETTNIIKPDHKAAYMYIAQCCIATHKAAYIYIFRQWDDVIDFFKALSAYLMLGNIRRVICWIANQGFEFQFLRKRLKWQEEKFDFFSKEIRKPLLSTSGGIEFREALSISGGGLADLANNYCITKKLVGDLDYSIERNSHTVLTETELQYCYNDVIILAEFAEQMYDRYIRKLKKVPLTSTGLLRSEVKDRFNKQPDAEQQRQLLQWMFPTKEQYEFWFEYLFRGGYVHTNVLYAGQKIEKLFWNYDITSSYPFQLNCRYYPMSKFQPVEFTTMEEFKHLLETKCVIFNACFRNIRQTTTHSIESYSKCIDVEGYELDNGRIRRADRLTVCLTEIDYCGIYEKFYKWDGEPYIYDIYVADRGYLPPYMLDVLNEHYKNKDEMKRRGWHKDPKHIADYTIEKQRVNAFYGMCVTRIQLTQIKYSNDWVKVKDKLDYNKEKKNQVLLPQWGIYCTCWARFQLLSTIYRIFQVCGNITAYGDTDSCKNLYHPLLQSVIDAVNAEIMEMKRRRGLTDKCFETLGTFDKEENYICAKFNGAKRYIATYEDGSVHATIAGLPKDAILKIKDDPYRAFSNVRMNITADLSGKLGSAYIDDEVSDIVAGEEMHEKSCIALFPMSFDMKIDKKYHNLMIQYMMEGDVL